MHVGCQHKMLTPIERPEHPIADTCSIDARVWCTMLIAVGFVHASCCVESMTYTLIGATPIVVVETVYCGVSG